MIVFLVTSHTNSYAPNQGYGNRTSSGTHGLPYSSYKPQLDSYGHGPSVPPVCHPYSNMSNSMPMRTNGNHQPTDSHNPVHPHSPTVSQENGTTYFQNSIHHPNGIHQRKNYFRNQFLRSAKYPSKLASKLNLDKKNQFLTKISIFDNIF